MNRLQCELCGSIDMVKTDGDFVCQSCGCRYTPEEARRIVLSGSVDVSGSTVKMDNSAFVEKYLANARRAMQKEDWEEVEKYYNLVEQNDPTNIEAIFYSSFGKAKTLLRFTGPSRKTSAAFTVLKNSISIIDDNYDFEETGSQNQLIVEMAKYIIALYPTNPYHTLYYMCIPVANAFCESIGNIIQNYPSEKRAETVIFYEYLIKINQCMLPDKNMTKTVHMEINSRIMEYHNAWHNIDPSHIVPEPPAVGGGGGGCYVATAVYGSYNCPEVWTLRRYRDYTLAETWYGRAFIHTYYALCPTIVKWFGDTVWFRKMWKGRLDRMVKKLQDNGTESTPYEDRNW